MRNIITGAIVAAILAILGVATWKIFEGNSKITDFNNWADKVNSIIEKHEDNGNIGDHVKGSADAPVVIIEYADYQCEGCASMNPKVNKAVEQSDGKLVVVYRSFLLSYHQNATAAASAAEAAGLQGYWKAYADLLFANQSEWNYASASERTSLFKDYFMTVSDGKGDLNKFQEDIKSTAVKKKIDFDIGIGKRMDIGGTPSFYIDGQLINWSQPDSITINGKTITWDKSMGSEENFLKLMSEVVEAKLSK